MTMGRVVMIGANKSSHAPSCIHCFGTIFHQPLLFTFTFVRSYNLKHSDFLQASPLPCGFHILAFCLLAPVPLIAPAELGLFFVIFSSFSLILDLCSLTRTVSTNPCPSPLK